MTLTRRKLLATVLALPALSLPFSATANPIVIGCDINVWFTGRYIFAKSNFVPWTIQAQRDFALEEKSFYLGVRGFLVHVAQVNSKYAPRINGLQAALRTSWVYAPVGTDVITLDEFRGIYEEVVYPRASDRPPRSRATPVPDCVRTPVLGTYSRPTPPLPFSATPNGAGSPLRMVRKDVSPPLAARLGRPRVNLSD